MGGHILYGAAFLKKHFILFLIPNFILLYTFWPHDMWETLVPLSGIEPKPFALLEVQS